jgi:hypothetical protein
VSISHDDFTRIFVRGWLAGVERAAQRIEECIEDATESESAWNAVLAGLAGAVRDLTPETSTSIEKMVAELVANRNQAELEFENWLSEAADGHAWRGVRWRNAFGGLGIKTFADLLDSSEADLMAERNFGRTSILHLRYELAKIGKELKRK